MPGDTKHSNQKHSYTNCSNATSRWRTRPIRSADELPWACRQPRCASEPCPQTLSAGRSEGPTCITDPPARSVGTPSRGSPGNASLPSVRWNQTAEEIRWRLRCGLFSYCFILLCGDLECSMNKWFIISLEYTPVLDVFPNNQEVWFDEPLDDLTVPLLPSCQLPGYGNRLETDKPSE